MRRVILAGFGWGGILVTGFCLGFTPHPAIAGPAQYTIMDLGTLGGDPPGTTPTSTAYAVNNNGQVVGWALTGAGVQDAFLYSGGQMHDLGNFGTATVAYDINRDGQVIGYGNGPNGVQGFIYSNGNTTNVGTLEPHGINNLGQVACDGYSKIDGNLGFLYDHGNITNLGSIPGSPGGEVFVGGINDYEQIVGDCESDFPFLYAGGTMSSIALPISAFGLIPLKINNAGQVVGRADGSGFSKAVSFANGVWTDVAPIGASFSEANGVNNRGDVVGHYIAGAHAGAFLYSGGITTDLNDLLPSGSGWELIAAYGINDGGQIVGWGFNSSFQGHAFLMTPVPEPAALGLLLLTQILLRRREGNTNARHSSQLQ